MGPEMRPLWLDGHRALISLGSSAAMPRCDNQGSSETELILQINNQIRDHQNVFFDMEAYLPKRNRFAYKDEYEKFKLYLTIILLLGAVACRFVLHYRIKGWWVSHHYISTFLSGVMLTWPEGLMYQMFRNQFLSFSIFQKGFQSWMWRGLTFLLPFLFFGQFWQLYNAITLFELSRHEKCKEWQVSVLALTFLILFLGNFLTTLKVVHTKLQKNKTKKL
ncbi:hypothetical protein E2320_012465 [Naja naja]|nr:hypothetical protein E2320_012465 [Naja naja]